MNDRAQRAELEALQTQLREARQRLVQPLDGLRHEVAAELDRLAQEGHALRRTVDALTTEADDARLRLISERTDRPSTFRRKVGTSSLTLLTCGAIAGGAVLGLWLEGQHVPTWGALACCGGAALIGFFDLSRFVRWLKK